MSRLICLDPAPGRQVLMPDGQYTVKRYSRERSRVLLISNQPPPTELFLTMDQFSTLLVTEKAELLDELEDPEPGRKTYRSVTCIATLPASRIIDWHAKVFFLKSLMRMTGASPQGSSFRGVYQDAVRLLQQWYADAGLLEAPIPKVWTCYHDLLKWRRGRYSLGAVQTKGVEYCPQTPKQPLALLARELLAETIREKPSLSSAALHHQVNKSMHSRVQNLESAGTSHPYSRKSCRTPTVLSPLKKNSKTA